MTEQVHLKAGSRKSQLAVIQTESVIECLQSQHPHVVCSIETMETIGDQILDKPLPKIGEKSLFTKDLEIALLNEKVDFIVHSLKDLPTSLPDSLAIGTVLKRASPYDAVLFHPKHTGKTLSTLPEKSVIGTSSLRRIAQIRRNYPALNFMDVRGNLNTRIKKLDAGDKYDALILAEAGVRRMNWQDRIGQQLNNEDCLYAVGQGALAVEVREKDDKILDVMTSLTDLQTLLCCTAERSFLRTLEGGCSVPVGVNSKLTDCELTLTGAVFSLDGEDCVKGTLSTTTSMPGQRNQSKHVVLRNRVVVKEHWVTAVQAAEDLGCSLAKQLRQNGADAILTAVRARVESSVDIHKPIKET